MPAVRRASSAGAPEGIGYALESTERRLVPLAEELDTVRAYSIEGVEVAGEATDGAEALRLAAELTLDAMLLDIEMRPRRARVDRGSGRRRR